MYCKLTNIEFINLMEELFMSQKERFYADIMAMHPEVTGSCHLVIVKFPDGESLRFVVDCGLYQEVHRHAADRQQPQDR